MNQPRSPLPTLLVWVLAIQFAIALAFFALGWSHSSSMSFGRTPSLADIMALAGPLACVILCGAVAVSAARRGRLGLAWLLAIVPLPLAFMLAMLAGMV